MIPVLTVFLTGLAGAFQPPTTSQVAAVVHTTEPATTTGAGTPTWSNRLVRVTTPFLDAPYVHSPLGEGPDGVVDTDPRLRFDAFDCTTFVETAMALALAPSLDDAQGILDLIRYRRGLANYESRRHFPEAEWLPELAAAGLLEDITHQVAGDDVAMASKQLNQKVWDRARHKGLPPLPEGRVPDGIFSLPIWPLDKALEHPERIPDGTVLNLVRVDFASVPVRVSHQGLIVTVNGQKMMRHAADRMHHRVVDEPLPRFLKRMSHYQKWPVAGVNLARFAPQPDWRARLAGTATASPALASPALASPAPASPAIGPTTTSPTSTTSTMSGPPDAARASPDTPP